MYTFKVSIHFSIKFQYEIHERDKEVMMSMECLMQLINDIVLVKCHKLENKKIVRLSEIVYTKRKNKDRITMPDVLKMK